MLPVRYNLKKQVHEFKEQDEDTWNPCETRNDLLRDKSRRNHQTESNRNDKTHLIRNIREIQDVRTVCMDQNHEHEEIM